MYNVSTAYKQEIEKPVRNPSHIRITFGITNTDAVAVSTATDNGHLSYSDVNSVDLGLSVASPYATLEPKRWLLNGAFSIANLSNPTYQGYIGNELSNAQGEWSINPTITINFSDYQQFAGLSFEFDNNGREWHPESFKVEALKDGTGVFNKTFSPTDEYFVINDQIPPCNEIIITYLKNNNPFSRARLEGLIYGIVERMTAADISACNCTREVDLISSSYPKYDFNFTIFDKNGEYNPENPQGVWEYLETRQPVQVAIGYELNSGNIEWMPWANTYTSGEFSVNGTGINTKVEIKSVGLINHLTQEYGEGKYYENGRSLYDLAYDVMNYAGFGGAIEVDESLKNIISMQPLPIDKINNLLQLIANAGRCVLNVERGGTISIKPEKTTVEDFTMDFSKMSDFPETSKIPMLRYINFTYSTVSVGENQEELYTSEEITADEPTEYTFTYDTATNQDYTKSTTLTVSNVSHFANKTVMTLQGTGTVTIKGNRLIYNEAVASKRYHELGTDLDTLSNELVTNEADANAYIDWIAAYEMRRNTYSIADRGYPELDTGDTVNFVSTYLNNITATQLSSTIEYNGAIKNTASKYLIKEVEQ